jgi:plastocyanin
MRLWSRTPVAILALTLLALPSCSRERSGDVHDGSAGSDAVEVTLHDDAFEPDVLHLDAGNEVSVEVRNEGGNGHNFTIDDLDLSTGTVEPGNVVTANFVVPEGTTTYHCTFHPGMSGEIVAS